MFRETTSNNRRISILIFQDIRGHASAIIPSNRHGRLKIGQYILLFCIHKLQTPVQIDSLLGGKLNYTETLKSTYVDLILSQVKPVCSQTRYMAVMVWRVHVLPVRRNGDCGHTTDLF